MTGGWRAPAFWWQAQPSPKALLLWPLGWVYGAISARRMLRKAEGGVATPVVCIGNFVVGGAGKTPFALALRDLLERAGHRPVFLLRGYGGRLRGPLLVDPNRHTAADIGDEALLLARAGPTVMARDRLEGAKFAESHGDVILMDDGYQNPRLAKDFSFALADAATGVGNGFCLPAGPLRAPVRRQIAAAHALVVVGRGKAADPLVRLAARKGLPIFHAELAVQPDADLIGARVLAFAGIGRPSKFFDSLRAVGVDVVSERSFPDHHPFSGNEAEMLLKEAERLDLTPVTTAKDMVRLTTGDGELLRWLAGRSRVVEAAMRIDEGAQLLSRIEEAIRRKRLKQG